MKDLIQIFRIKILLGRRNAWNLLSQKCLAIKIRVRTTFHCDITKSDHKKSYTE